MMTARAAVRLRVIGQGTAVLVTLGLAATNLADSLDPLDPLRIPKYVDALVIPPPMPPTGTIASSTGALAPLKAKSGDYYEIAVRQFMQQILPTHDIYGAVLNPTTVWGYGSINHPSTFNYPSFTIEATVGRPIRVKWVNELKDAFTGEFLPHLLAVDQTLHWANPGGGIFGRDTRPTFEDTPFAYGGPVPIVTHVHGAHTYEDSDGYAEAWYLPTATNIPFGYATVGSKYEEFKAKAAVRSGLSWPGGTSVFDYPNDQAATTLWYHDHTLGMTRLNVYAGPAGFYLLRGGPTDMKGKKLPGPAPALGDSPGTKYYEIPIAIQDRIFREDGSLYYPTSRSFFDGIMGPYIPFTDISPIWNPEFFGNVMVVNGKSWPVLNVEPRRYRFRLLNGCNSRFLILKMSDPSVPIWQIGAEGGFLPAPVAQEQLLMSPAERADVIVDFSALAPGTEVILLNCGPDEPFAGGEPGQDFDAADPNTTGQVMMFRVVPLTSKDQSMDPAKLQLPKQQMLVAGNTVHQVALMEMMSMFFDDAPAAAMLGVMENGVPMHKMWADPITEMPLVGRVEIWELYNFTADAHPVHLHQVQFQVVNRQDLVLDEEDMPVVPVELSGTPSPPQPWERGFKDTVIAYPGQVTRLKARFDLPGLFVWHCHIVEHEDNEMMRPLMVGTGP